MKPEDIVELEEPKLSGFEQTFVPAVLAGLGTTLRHIGRTLRGKHRTMQYPEQRREQLPVLEGGMDLRRYRGIHRLNRDEQGRVKCVACYMCSTACPAKCIQIVGGESPPPWSDREKYPVKFDIDELRCIYCGMCEEACPVNAIELTYEYEMVSLTRSEMIYDKEKLLLMYDRTVENKPM